MNLKNFFSEKDTIYLNEIFKSKSDVLNFFSNELVKKGYGKNQKQLYELFIERENQSSTGIGEGIAIPHLNSSLMQKGVLLFAKVNNLNWNSIDNQPVKYVFGIAFSNHERENAHLKVISKLSQLLVNENFKKELDLVLDADSFLQLIEKYENKNTKNSKINLETTYDIVAVTSCPTGIAHTYLAKESLEKQALKMNLNIKVETQGADGITNTLTNEEIKSAKGVILAIDREIEKNRFVNSSNVLEISTQKAIHKPEEQIKKILNNQGNKIESSNYSNNLELNTSEEIGFNNFGKKMYRSLMTGISHMLPFVVFGGILIALGFIIDIIIGLSNGQEINSKDFLANFGFNHSVSNLIFNIGKIGLGLMVPILSAYIAFSLVGRQGLLPGFVVGAIASGQLSGTYGFLTGAIQNSGIADAGKFLGTGSGFIGGILGAFFAAAMIIVFQKYIFGRTPKTLQGIKNILFIPLFGTLTIALVFWAVNIVLIFVNLGLVLFLQLFQDKPYLAWLLGLILGAMMAIDLGGPINKAAYIFGILTISNGTSSIAMAAIMAAGMVPPLGISLSMFIHRKLWTKEEIEAGKISNIVFGLSFISEGAIPYTSRRPKILIPANIAGGAIAGIISSLLGVNIIAPHGGLFVSFLARTNLFDNLSLQIGFGILFWIGAILVGAIVQMLVTYFLSIYYSKQESKVNENN
ncbi:PTS fructose transporter subunit IIABC [Mycoplasmopsis cricetuli]|uniref:PTS fructose transporter subunit IIABC n=1 Tax=Mycoplasmopsis cricetuli TaxID=171283 RepID=UPI00056D0BC6|nr:fructose-specific PTS transporter subunit EIIC [Mycoplasmopsis cricetuli]